MSDLCASGSNFARASPVKQTSYCANNLWSIGSPAAYEMLVFSSTDCHRNAVSDKFPSEIPVRDVDLSGTSKIKTSRSTISTSLATCTAVNGLSPVIITHYVSQIFEDNTRCEDSFNIRIVLAASAFKGQLNTKNPPNSRSCSTSSLANLLIYSAKITNSEYLLNREIFINYTPTKTKNTRSLSHQSFESFLISLRWSTP